jgi:hypothetical protein
LAQAFVLGCKQGPFEFVPVEGKVVYEDGSPVTGGQLQFVSQAPPEGTSFPRPALAHIKGDGTFDAVTSHKFGDGLVAGRHKVAIQNAVGSDGKPLVPEAFTSIATTPLEIDTADTPLTITVPKP